MAIVGCDSLGSYETAKQAVEAAQNGQLDAFQHELTIEACDTLGTGEAMAAIREKLGRYARIEIRKPVVIAEKGDFDLTYKMIVAGVPRNSRRAEAVYTVDVHCWPMIIPTDYTFMPDECSSLYDANGAEQRVCSPGAPVHYATGLIVVCGVKRITE